MCWNRNTIINFEKENSTIIWNKHDHVPVNPKKMHWIDKNAHGSGQGKIDIVSSKGINRVYTDPIEHSDDNTDTANIEVYPETKAVMSIYFFYKRAHNRCSLYTVYIERTKQKILFKELILNFREIT